MLNQHFFSGHDFGTARILIFAVHLILETLTITLFVSYLQYTADVGRARALDRGRFDSAFDPPSCSGNALYSANERTCCQSVFRYIFIDSIKPRSYKKKRRLCQKSALFSSASMHPI